MQSVIPKYQKAAEDLKVVLGKLHEKIEKIITETNYKPLADSLNNYMNHINTEIKTAALAQFTAWKSGESSYTHYAMTLQSGDAISTAASVEASLEQIMINLWGNEILPLVTTDTSKPFVKVAHFDDLSQQFNSTLNELKGVKDTLDAEISAMESDDTTVTASKAALVILTDYVVNPIIHCTENINKNKEDIVALSASQKNASDSAKQAVTQQALTSEGASNLLNMLSGVNNIEV